MLFSAVGIVAALATGAHAKGPFLQKVNDTTHVIGNDFWNVTIGQQYGVKLYYKGQDLVGNAWGHYVSYNGAASDLNWTSVSIERQTREYLDIKFTANEGDFHWVVFDDLVGAYQYFVNHALPTLGEFRTLWRLDNTSFPKGRTNIKDEPLPSLSDIVSSTKVQDETWERSDGTYITKYDFTAWIRDQDYYGVYGDQFGSWYINPGKDYYNGNHLKQELMVHRESSTGDAVQLNMIHGTHFQVSSDDAFPDGKLWGPWLWYLNDGSKEDAANRAKKEFTSWPYKWFRDEEYHSRGSVSGKLVLSDGRPAAGASVFLGDNNPNKTALDMGTLYYYTSQSDSQGNFVFHNVRTGDYGLQAWSNGGLLSDVFTTFLQNDVTIRQGRQTRLGKLRWAVPSSKKVFQIGDFDRKSLGFKYGGAPYQHALVANCPANLTYTVGKSETSEWCFGQSAAGTWSVRFLADQKIKQSPSRLMVSLAGYSSGTTSEVLLNGDQSNPIGNLTTLPNDPCLYRSATTAGEWRIFEFDIPEDRLRPGWNTIDFHVTKSSRWHGFMWDSIILQHA
ncbi:polysaccharide lyase family 4, domain III-domain-containing protein [Aspergillus ambiguus]|uniref:putative rhamnogalacturonase n=1 Tax=Aspergillus ambiguus TaxID=176160 RepID=UPI003CCD8C0A